MKMTSFNQVKSQLEAAKEFSDFKAQYPKAYLCSAFFVLDFESGNNQQQINFAIPDKSKVATFVINSSVKIKIDEEDKALPQLNPDIKVEIDDVVDIVKQEVAKLKSKKRLNKIIAVLQKDQEDQEQVKQIWNLTCLLESFGMLYLHIDSLSGEILKSELGSLFDFVMKPKTF